MRRKLFLSMVLLLTVWTLSAQDYEAPEVKISSERANIAGKVYYVHKVEPKQTIFSICKAYGVTQEALLEANPSLADGLKAGSSILVPETAGDLPDADREEVSVASSEKEQKKWYEKLLGLFSGSELISISWNKEKEAPAEPEPTVHDFLKEQNPDQTPVQTPVQVSVPAPSMIEKEVEEPAVLRIFDRTRPLRISLLLPFNASNDPSSNYFDFYCGVLSALRELKEDGYCVELSVFDTKASNPLNDSSLKESDLIIGPVHASDIGSYAEFAKENEIPMVSPMDSRSTTFIPENPYFFLAPATDSIQLCNLVKSLEVSSHDNVYVFYNSTMKEKSLVNRITSSLDSAGIPYRHEAYNILKGRELGERLGHQWSEKGSYKIIVASSDAAFAPDVVRNLKQITRNNVPLEIYCLNELRSFESSIDYDTFYLTNAHFSAPYWVDYSDERTHDFLLKYRALFNTEPTAFSFQGYDLMKYCVSTMYDETLDISEATSLPYMHGLQGSFRFERPDKNSGWQNTATRNIIYSPDFTVTSAR